MRVILNNLPEIETEIICDHCRSILAYTYTDIDAGYEEYGNEYHFYKYVKCPVCGTKIVIEVDGMMRYELEV